MTISIRLIATLVMVGGLLATGCGGDDVDTGPEQVEGIVVGAAGATVDLPGGGALAIPSGALAQDITIDVTKIAAPRSNVFEAAGQFVRIDPLGQALAKGAALEMPYNTDDVSTEDGNLGVAWSVDGSVWAQLPTEVDQGDRVLLTSIDQFLMVGPALFIKPSEICCLFSDDEGNKTGEILSDEACQAQEGLVHSDVASCDEVCCELTSGDGSKMYKLTVRAGCPQLGGVEADLASCEQ